MTIPPYASSWTDTWMKQFGYAWLRNYLGLIPLRVNCWTHCWMSDAAWTEWKNYSRPRYNYVAWPPGNIPFSVFRSTTLGTRSLFASGKQQHEMSIQVRKSVRRLRISKSLTCDALNAALSSRPGHVMTPSKPFAYGFEVSEISGRTSWPSSEFVSGRPPWIGDDYQPPEGQTRWDNSDIDIVGDIRNFVEWKASQ